jgi:two-component system, OmpR family, phosphate regulon sensor histidine kinase PhoR
MKKAKKIQLLFHDKATLTLLENNILGNEDFEVFTSRSVENGLNLTESLVPDLLIMGDDLEGENIIEVAKILLDDMPTLPIILFSRDKSILLDKNVVRLGLVDILIPPLKAEVVIEAVERGLKRSSDWEIWLKKATTKFTGPLIERVYELEMISKVGQVVTAQLDLDKILASVVESAVEVTGAEKGSILLIDELNDELYVRASYNLNEAVATSLRLPVNDSMAGQVVETGESVIVNAPDSVKIKTSYFVKALIYVPLIFQGKVIGVLGVDNQEHQRSFKEKDVTLLSAIADYSVVAIENWRLYNQTELERKKLSTILSQVDDGVIVIDENENILLLNEKAKDLFFIDDQSIGKQFTDVFQQEEMLGIFYNKLIQPERAEIKFSDKRFYGITHIQVSGLGTILTLHDISYLKELDRLKTDFVNAVSHDLRSPLTSILGYSDLIHRVGDVNEKQTEFINRIKLSVDNITALISDLLDLGRVEIGLDESVVAVPISPVLSHAINAFRFSIHKKNIKLISKFKKDLPNVKGNPIQLRQMMENLIGNAIKYTHEGGRIGVYGKVQEGQVILQVSDNGRGIPSEDQPKIFNRFYRATNTVKGDVGTGLGLAITKTIVDNHRGRIWVESLIDKGSSFTVMLPIMEE